LTVNAFIEDYFLLSGSLIRKDASSMTEVGEETDWLLQYHHSLHYGHSVRIYAQRRTRSEKQST